MSGHFKFQIPAFFLANISRSNALRLFTETNIINPEQLSCMEVLLHIRVVNIE